MNGNNLEAASSSGVGDSSNKNNNNNNNSRGGRKSRKTQKRQDYKAEKRSGGFTVPETRLLQQYLEEYRQGALEAYKQEQQQQGDNNKKKISCHENLQEISIAGISFPSLSHSILSSSYLKLPSALSAQQRRTIHNACADMGLYHCAIGTGSTRCLVISIYCDVFSSLPGFAWPSAVYQQHNYRPWICTSTTSVHAHTRRMKEQIQQLIDQPSTCLRDTDDYDFKLDPHQNLASVPPPHSTDANWQLVDTPDAMLQCAQELTHATEIAFDVEAFNPNQYTQRTCLLQLTSTFGTQYIIDPLAPGVWDTVGPSLAPLFANPHIVKIGHAMGGLDVRCLYRDFGIAIVNAFDTYEAARVLQLPSHGLAAVCQYYGLTTYEQYTQLKDMHQTMDWRQRPLSESMILYGRYDVHYLLQLRQLMIRDLVLADRLYANSYVGAMQHIQDMEDQMCSEEWAQYNDEYDDTNAVNHTAATTIDSSSTNNNNNHHHLALNDEDDTIDNGDSPDDAKESDNVAGDDHHMPNHQNNGDSNGNNAAIVTVEELRMQPSLMTVLTESQYRCRGMAKHTFEFHVKNSLFVSLLWGGKKTKKKKQQRQQLSSPLGPLTNSQIILYDNLVRLRLRVADQCECLAGFICSLEELALIAAGRPTCIAALRVIDYFLPERLGATTTRQVLRLTRQSLEREQDNVRAKSVFDNHAIPRNKPLTTKRKLLVGSVVVGSIGVVVSMVLARRKQR
ncbi:Protein RRP6-like [Seminavis robusta]|uniref:Protein RRP6-like n=1 Tax=Seminavis robusta TaxID=568900 RepID=A0A9N8HR21_9STRA|nr:Protein RRP6-like [Seminavis robusta]|eukprot:Sro1266_g257590.1 Protein RRP6-like (732) ;mRNA; r:21900-24095